MISNNDLTVRLLVIAVNDKTETGAACKEAAAEIKRLRSITDALSAKLNADIRGVYLIHSRIAALESRVSQLNVIVEQITSNAQQIANRGV